MPNEITDIAPFLDRPGRSDAGLPSPIADRPANEAEIEEFKAAVLAKLALAVGKDGEAATPRDWFVATALALRDRIIYRWLEAGLLFIARIPNRPTLRRCRRKPAAD
jgi:hypothetical protein